MNGAIVRDAGGGQTEVAFRTGRLGPLAVIAVSGFASIGWMAITNFVIDSDFKWILLAFALPWVMALVLSWVGARRIQQ